MPTEKIKKVTANVYEQYVEPEYHATYECPYCGRKHHEEVYDENTTSTVKCNNQECGKKFKVKIPKYL